MIASFCNTKLQEFTILLQFQPYFVLSFSVLNLVFSVVATLGNLFVIRALWKASSIPATLKPLFLSLAFSDLAVGLYVQPMFGVINAMTFTSGTKKDYNFSFLCPSVVTANMFFAYLATGASFFTIAAIALDRFVAVTLHLRYNALVTEKRVVICVVILWLSSGLAGVALMAISSNNYLICAVFQTSGLLVITVAYVHVFKVVRHHQNQIQSQHQIINGQAIDALRLKKSTLSAFYVYIICLACYLPSLFVSIPLIVDNFEASFLLAYYAAGFLIFLNSSLNPLVYCWRYREIRSIVKNTVKKCFCINDDAAW